MSAKAWCFTCNNYTDEDIEMIKTTKYEYLIFGKEVAPTTGTPHLQGYIVFTGRKTMSSAREALLNCHIAKAKGNSQQNYDYCSKGGDFEEYGIRPKQGSRSDIKRAKDMAFDGAPMLKILEEVDSYQAVKMAQLIKIYQKPKRREPPEVIWICGGPGTGKTRYVYDREDDIYICNDNAKWFDGYDNDEVVLIDDWRPEWSSLNFLLQFLDRYPCRLPIKCGFTYLNCKKIYITSPIHPHDVRYGKEDMEQLWRRITTIIEL